MLDLLQGLTQLGRQWGAARFALWRAEARAAWEREQRRLFDALALLTLGLFASTMAVSGLLLLLWTELPERWRGMVVGSLLMLLLAMGLALLAAARRRLGSA